MMRLYKISEPPPELRILREEKTVNSSNGRLPVSGWFTSVRQMIVFFAKQAEHGINYFRVEVLLPMTLNFMNGSFKA